MNLFISHKKFQENFAFMRKAVTVLMQVFHKSELHKRTFGKWGIPGSNINHNVGTNSLMVVKWPYQLVTKWTFLKAKIPDASQGQQSEDSGLRPAMFSSDRSIPKLYKDTFSFYTAFPDKRDFCEIEIRCFKLEIQNSSSTEWRDSTTRKDSR